MKRLIWVVLAITLGGGIARASYACAGGGRLYCHGADGCNWTDGEVVITHVHAQFMIDMGCGAYGD